MAWDKVLALFEPEEQARVQRLLEFDHLGEHMQTQTYLRQMENRLNLRLQNIQNEGVAIMSAVTDLANGLAADITGLKTSVANLEATAADVEQKLTAALAAASNGDLDAVTAILTQGKADLEALKASVDATQASLTSSSATVTNATVAK